MNLLESPAKPGLYFDMTFEDYVAIPAINSHSITAMRQSPRHFANKMWGDPAERKETWQLRVGKAFDLAIFEPQAFAETVVVEPDLNKNSKEFKAWRAGLAPGAIALSHEQYTNVAAMADSIFKKKSITRLLSSGWPQLSMVWHDPATGLPCKGRLDWLTSDMIIVDLKKTMNASRWAFSFQSRDLGYWYQAAYYLWGASVLFRKPMQDFCWICCEDYPPYESAAYRSAGKEVFRCQEHLAQWLETIAECCESDTWPGYPDDFLELTSASYSEMLEYYTKTGGTPLMQGE